MGKPRKACKNNKGKTKSIISPLWGPPSGAMNDGLPVPQLIHALGIAITYCYVYCYYLLLLFRVEGIAYYYYLLFNMIIAITYCYCYYYYLGLLLLLLLLPISGSADLVTVFYGAGVIPRWCPRGVPGTHRALQSTIKEEKNNKKEERHKK